MRKSKNHIRFMTLLLATLMLLSSLTVLAGCADSGDDVATDTETSGTDTVSEEETAEETETASPYESFEKTKYNKEFVILNRAVRKADFEITADDGKSGLLDELLVERNTVVAEDYGITFVYEYGTDYNDVNSRVSRQSMNSLDDYDVAIGHKYSVTTCVINGYLTDLLSIDALSLEEEWWDQGCRSSLTVNGKLGMMTGDVLPSSMMISSCFAFNKKIMSELGKTAPYDLVRSGNWTLDEFNAMTKDVTRDVNGDGELDYQHDLYGMSCYMMGVPFDLFYGAGGMFGSVGEDGLPALSFENEDVINRYEKIYQAIIGQQAYFVKDESMYDTVTETFATGHALFCDTSLNQIRGYFADMADDYGIVPMPKYDTNQKEYLSFVNGSSAFIMIVNTESDPEYVGTILEAMARYNYENVSTKMFEIITKLQNVRDQDSGEMVDYIIRNRVFDFAYYFDLSVSNVVLNRLKEGKAEISSKLTATRKTSDSELKQILRKLKKKN